MGLSSVGSTGGGVAWFAHIGGFAFGWLIIRFYRRKKDPAYTTTVSYDRHDDDYDSDDGQYYDRWH